VQGAPLRHPKSVVGAGTDAATGPFYLRPSNLLVGALMRLSKHVPEAGAIAPACPPCANPLAGVLVQGAPRRHPESVAGARPNAATAPSCLCPSNLLHEALVRQPNLVPRAGAIAAACPSCANPLAGFLMQVAPLRHPQSVAGAGADAATGPPYLRPSCLELGALKACRSLFRVQGPLQLLALLVQSLWLASWCTRPHCAIINQLLELELMLLLAFLTFASAACYKGPWCACQSSFLELLRVLLSPLLSTPFGLLLCAGGAIVPS